MSETTSAPTAAPTKFTPGTPSWVDANSTDVPASRAFYTQLFGWEAMDLPPDAGGYLMFTLGGAIVAAVGATQMEGQPSSWSVYFATEDADETSRKVVAAGGQVTVPAFDVLDQGRMAVYQDPTGAYFSVWEGKLMAGLGKAEEANTFSWAELNAPGIDRAEPFYREVFGWGTKKAEAKDGAPPYTEWQVDGKSIGGGMDTAGVPGMENIPPHWLVYFEVADIDATAARAKELGGTLHMGPQEYPGGRFAVVGDPTGASFGLMQSSAA
ncbi:MAG: uncharacterized protein QOK05_2228 [Chloroflexota bacterium]|jgi:predicted enzyme related to lactoylglutathione lyase|nr:uncharacterized protein [Chloroflexota bacterium]